VAAAAGGADALCGVLCGTPAGAGACWLWARRARWDGCVNERGRPVNEGSAGQGATGGRGDRSQDPADCEVLPHSACSGMECGEAFTKEEEASSTQLRLQRDGRGGGGGGTGMAVFLARDESSTASLFA
jgi:hypothetical protein